MSSFSAIKKYKKQKRQNILFVAGPMNFKIFDLKIISASVFPIFEFNLFHLLMVDGKYEFLIS